MQEQRIDISDKMRIELAGESSLIVYLCNERLKTAEMTDVVAAFVQEIHKQLFQVVIDVIPSFESVLVSFDLFEIDYAALHHKIVEISKAIAISNQRNVKSITLPVYYHGSASVDLPMIAKQSHLSVDEVIKIHHSVEYTVQAIGFAPGFSYLGDVDQRIQVPRLSTPRALVPKGAVAIANQQTAIYPQASPGGWNIIGLCPTTLFDANAQEPSIFSVGDSVRFEAIDKDEFMALGGVIGSVSSAT